MMRVTTLKVALTARLARSPTTPAAVHDRQRQDSGARGPVDYYLDRGEPPCRWWGQGCGWLGLQGSVEPEQFEALLNGGRPREGGGGWVRDSG
jgi:hypothetical protein